MKLKSSLLICSALFLAASASAQDKIYKRNGEVIDAKVSEVNQRNISYKKADNESGPNYVIGKNEVERVEYANGSEDVFNQPDHRMQKEGKAEKVRYGKNILALAPLQISEGFGVGLSYERVLDKKGIISFYLPATVSFNSNNYYNGGVTPLGSTYPYYGSNVNYNTYYIMPGVKIYPTGSKGKVRYSVGPSLALVMGQAYTTTSVVTGYDQYGNPIYTYGNGLGDRFTLGVMVNNTLNIQPTPHLYLGLELGLGVSYFNTINNVNAGETSLGQFGFKMGYRF